MTLRRKLLFHTYLLTALLILAMSLTYYYLFTKGIRERSQQNVTMTFTQIFDDLTTRVRNGQSKIEHLVSESLVNPLSVIQMFQGQQTSDQPVSLWYVKKVLTYLQTIITEFREFGRLIDASEMLLYGKEGNLLVIYRDEGDSQIAGAYFPEVDPEQLITLHPDDFWYATLQELTEIPLQAFPRDLLSVYPGTMPETMTVMFATSQNHLTIRFWVPIFIEGTLHGFCVIHLGLQQKDVERYARLSGTEVNVFTGTDLSVGTLPDYRALPPNMMDTYHVADFLDVLQTPPVQFSELTVAGRSYYQGLLAVGDKTTPVGGIAVHYSRQLEEKEKQAFFQVVVGIAVIFSVLAIAEAFGFSAMLVRPILHLMSAMQEIKRGNFQVEAAVETNDEIGRLADTFNTMSARLNTSFETIAQQNRELQQLDKLKDEFLANTSHELRTPLNGIAGLSDALLCGIDGPVNEQQQRHLQMIHQSSKRLTNLVNAILDFSKIRAQQFELQIEPFPLTAVTDIVVEFARESVKHKSVILQTDIPTQLPDIHGDNEKVEQILTNLVNNAVKFTKTGSVSITVRQDGDFVRISVADTGIGISKEALERIFRPFEQADGSTTREFGGTGLGLSITKDLVEQHGGRIWVESEVDKGSVFHVTLPCKAGVIGTHIREEEDLAAPEELASQERREGVTEAALATIEIPPGEGTILVVDDDPTNVEVLRTQLVHAGFTALEAYDAKSAYEILKTQPVDLILCDVMMPGIDGYTFGMTLQEQPLAHHAPPLLMFVSAKDQLEDKLKGYHVGALDYMTKPIDPEVLRCKIQALLTLKSRQSLVSQEIAPTSDTIYEVERADEAIYAYPQKGNGETIVVIDDESINCEVLYTYLTQYNYRVITAPDGEDGLAKIDAESPDLVLLDLMMPKMSGFQVCHILRKEKQLKNLPVIILTAKSNASDKVYGLNIGANDYIVKPFNKDELLTKIHIFLRILALQNVLAEERNLLRTLIDHLPDFIYAKNTQSRYLLANTAVMRALGITAPDELLGKTDFDLLPKELAEQFYRSEQMILQSSQALINQEELTRDQQTGALMWLLTTKVPFRDTQGNILGLVGINRDITTRKQAEEELKRHRDHLEELVKERTGELSIANQQLRELNASKDKFFSIISHDLRSPFITILTLTQFLSGQPDISTNAEVNTKITLLRTSAERLYALLENLLTWARIQRGAMQCEVEVFDLFEIAEENIAIFESKAEHKKITLSNSIQENTLVYADFTMTNTVVRNLFSNALKFTEAGGRITLSANAQEEYIETAVSDTGCGIDEDGIAVLFRIDTQYTTTGTAGEQGTGLGLILCKELVEQNGGKIWVESEVGKGTTFRFTVPKQPEV
ncbi:MAG: response regulator [bacterium]|nr:response regulator [bacterium]